MTRRWLAVAAAVVGLAVCAFVAWIVLRDDGSSPGPVKTAVTDSASFPLVTGQTGSWGPTVLFNDSEDDAVLDTVRPVDLKPDGLEIVATRIGGPRRKFMAVGATYSWPHKHYTDLHPVEGMVIPPMGSPLGERGVHVVFAVRGRKPGRYTLTRLEVTYRAGGRRHTRVVGAGLAVCVTAREVKKPNCEPPDVTYPAALAED